MSRTELYRHFDRDGHLLYVGISLCTAARLAQHRIHSRWFDQVVKITIERFDDRPSALAAECAAIETEKPLCNVISSPKYPKQKSKVTFGVAAEMLGVDREMMRHNHHPVIKRLPHFTGTEHYPAQYSTAEINAYLEAGDK